MQPNQSRIEVGPGGTAFVGRDAVDLFRVKTLRVAINAHKRSGLIMTRGLTVTRMMQIATEITGKPYKGATKHDAALADLDAHIAAAEASMPIEYKA